MDNRHTSLESLDRYLGSEVPVVLPIRGTPAAAVFIRPGRAELGLRIDAAPDARVPDTGLRHIIARPARHDGRHQLEVVVVVAGLFRSAYPVLCAMADRVQVDGMTPARALRETLGQLADLLRAPDSLSIEREIGLFGELLTLNGLIPRLGGPAAIAAWRGADDEEHDFGLPDADVEVKTTIGERRVHWIGSLTQLRPTVGRPLWLVSHQLTAAGHGSGRSLPEVITEVGSALDGTTRVDFETKLGSAGWDDALASHVTSRWQRRRDSLAFHVDDRLPRLTPDALRRAGVAVDHLARVRYQVDLDGVTSADDPPALIAAAAGQET